MPVVRNTVHVSPGCLHSGQWVVNHYYSGVMPERRLGDIPGGSIIGTLRGGSLHELKS